MNTFPMNTSVGSLRYFGYFIKFDTNIRRDALNKAIATHGITPVINRLSTVANLSKSETMKEDLNWLIALDEIQRVRAWHKAAAEVNQSKFDLNRKNSSSVFPQQIKLSHYGYSTKKTADERLFALRSAFIANGYDSVIERMNFVINNYPKNKNIFKYDLDNFKASCGEPVAENYKDNNTTMIFSNIQDAEHHLLDKVSLKAHEFTRDEMTNHMNALAFIKIQLE